MSNPMCQKITHRKLRDIKQTLAGLPSVKCWLKAIMTSLALLAVLCFSFSFLSIVQARKRILVLGGDGMLGSETVARLKLRGHDITVLHRGNWYWDSSTRIKPWVNFVRCDRDSFNECVVQLVDITKEKGLFDAVIDFSGYKPGQVKVNKLSLLYHTLFWIYALHGEKYLLSFN